MTTLDNGTPVYRIYMEKLITDPFLFDDDANVSSIKKSLFFQSHSIYYYIFSRAISSFFMKLHSVYVNSNHLHHIWFQL